MQPGDTPISTDEPLALLEFSSRKRVPLVMQSEIAECGLACLAMVASYHGHKLDVASLRKKTQSSLSGMNLQQLINLADELNLASRALKCELQEIGELSLPCIIHWDLNHYVVLTGVKKRGIYINDPALGKQVLSVNEFSQHFTGIALELTPTSQFKKQDQRASMALSQLWSKLIGLKSGLLSLLTLSIILQAFTLATPYYMQWVMDEVLISQDISLLNVLAVGFSLLVVFNVISTAVRSYLILKLSSMMSFQMGINLLHHLLRLPMDFFERRHIGDIVSRFGSLSAIRERITTGVVETLVDGIMSISVLIMMLLYSPQLTAVVITAVVLYLLLRLVMYEPLRRNTEENIQVSAKEQTHFLENIRGIQTIKLFNCESMRQSQWQNRYAEVINSEIRLGKLNITFSVANNLLFSLENIIVIYIAANLIMANALSVGMMVAFVAYKTIFTQSVSSLIEQLLTFRMLKLHLERISDIALTEQEAHRHAECNLDNISGKIELKNLSFRYSDKEAWVVKDCNITLHAGEAVAIIGASGCGKSTLIKLLLGLLPPTEGQICLDDKDINQIGLTQYRNNIAAVMQNDTLLSGSVMDNICFFEPEPDLRKMQSCARLAEIDHDINKMPMGYNALVGDMGNQFSGGQVQRLLLARALYKVPKVLFMDEATSHLDMNKEERIGKHIKCLCMTRVIVAHRLETIKQADRVLGFQQGKLIEVDDIEAYLSANK